jgi:uncharacterized protein YkwD
MGSTSGGGVVLSDSELSEGGGGGLIDFPVIEQPVSHESFALLLNSERGAAGAIAVTEDPRLTLAAQAHAQDMVDNNYLSHTDLTGGRVGDRALAAGYDWNFIAENIAAGFNSNAAVVDAWMTSPGHAENMVDVRAEDFGLGRVSNTWVLMLGREFD